MVSGVIAMYFDDRLDAARRLADALRHFEGAHPLVLAIPRGAVPMAKLIAERLHGDFDVVLVRKLRAPFNPELAIGSVDEEGRVYVPEDMRDFGVERDYLQRETAEQSAVLHRRRAQYTPGDRGLDARGRVAIVVDDGLATGATMIAALSSVRARAPSRLVCAVPVASYHGLSQVRSLADEVVCLNAPPEFHAVSQFYRRFAQVEDDEVIALLAARRPALAATRGEAA
jgi:predicted phosphoribosyltransferase